MKRYLYDVITGGRSGFIPKLIIASLIPLSWLFETAARLRRAVYKRFPSLSEELPVPVLCVGSIVAGGTGKTPTVIALAEMFEDRGRRPVVICSGYAGRKGVRVVSDGERLAAGIEEVGDEAVMLGRKLLEKNIPVLAGRDRVKAGKLALRLFKPDILILDDGFQHLKLRRDVDLIVLDAESPLGTGKLLPAGTLREPPDALEEASMILLIGDNEEGKLKTSTPIFKARIEPTELRPIGKARSLPLRSLQGKKVLGLCSIGNPPSFRRTLLSLKVSSLEIIEFPDHHLYSEEDLDLIRERMKGFDLLITTEKDEPKLVRLGFSDGLVLEISVRLPKGLKHELMKTIAHLNKIKG